MEATTKDLRLHTRELIAATDRGEEVIITYRGKRRAKLVPCELPVEKPGKTMEPNPLFGLWNDQASDVDADVRALRAPRTFSAD
jgi:prevent-host-death family protein